MVKNTKTGLLPKPGQLVSTPSISSFLLDHQKKIRIMGVTLLRLNNTHTIVGTYILKENQPIMTYSNKKTIKTDLPIRAVGFMFGLVLLITCTRGNEGLFIPAAEFEEQESTLMCFNPNYQDISMTLIGEIAKEDHITLFYNERNHFPQKILELLNVYKVNKKNVQLVPFKMKEDNIWIRDYGPTMIQDEGDNQQIMTFSYPHEASQEYSLFNDQYSARLKLPLKRSSMPSSGGAREINGKGTIVLVESYEMSINPGMSKRDIENEYRQKLNQTNFIWLKLGIPQDDLFDNGPLVENVYGNGVNGHLDEFCRFADASTILLAQVDEKDIERDSFYKLIQSRLEENYQILNKSLDQDGKPFKIVRIPQAPVIFEQGHFNSRNIYYTPVTSYLNFVITNHMVVMPSYHNEGDPEFVLEKDLEAKEVLLEVFPGKKLVMLNPRKLNYSGGGFHCITLHKPKRRTARSKTGDA
jgi:agmatine deiminase